MPEGYCVKEDRADEVERLDPAVTTVELRSAARSLEKAAAKLGKLTKDFRGRINEETGEFERGPGARFEALVEGEVIRIYTEATTAQKRPPGEDVRRAMAEANVRKDNPALAADYDVMAIEITALKQFISSQKQVISGHQSVLSAAKVLTGFTNS